MTMVINQNYKLPVKSVNGMGGDVVLDAADVGAADADHTSHQYLDLPEIGEPTSPAADTARIYAVDRNGITELEVKDSTGLIHTVGEELLKRVRNTTGSPLSKGQVVYITGSTGSTPTADLALATSLATLPATGLLVEDIADNSFGRAIFSGLLDGFDTSAFLEGDPVWVSSTVAGSMTATAPVAPNYAQKVGVIVRSGVGNGSILVTVDAVDTTAVSIAALSTVYQPLDTQLTDLAGLDYTGNSLKVVRVNVGETGLELATVSGGGVSEYTRIDAYGDARVTADGHLRITN